MAVFEFYFEGSVVGEDEGEGFDQVGGCRGGGGLGRLDGESNCFYKWDHEVVVQVRFYTGQLFQEV